MKLDASIKALKGVGPKTEELFRKINVQTVGDLLFYFPRDYERYPNVEPLSSLKEGEKNAIFVQVKRIPSVNSRSQMQTATLNINENGEKVTLIWYRMPFVRSVIKAGGWYVFYGRVNRKDNGLYMEQPEIFSKDQYEEKRKSLLPVYSLTRGITNNLIQKTVTQILELQDLEMEYLSESIRTRNHLSEYNFALRNIHYPIDEQACILARHRFVFDEFFFFILAMQLTKEGNEKLTNSFSFDKHNYSAKVLAGLPYKLTNAQLRAFEQIRCDMNKPTIMQRLVQGDVGSGKTILAFLAMLDVVENGYQAAIMAPTDVLARQHYQKLTQLCNDFDIPVPVVLLTGSLTGKQRREAYAILEQDTPAFIVGTHALFQEKVNYGCLALVVTDEQHRFGVKQREAFSMKGTHPHIMVMSATPIPRTLAIILYGDLDISVIDEVPAVRKPIKNCVVGTDYRPTAYRFIEKELQAGHQCYVVCPLVEESELMDGENVQDYAKVLQSVLPSNRRVGILHGKMKPDEKNRVMEMFLNRELDVLVSTTVIEVGVDVPNATVMMIENADRFGLAQLHQLRGRVGRGDAQSYCIMINGNEKNPKNKRLEILNKSNDGFYIASEDLKLRGPGDFFGIRQSGEFEFQLADIYQDASIMEQASYEVSVLLSEDPKLESRDNRMLKERLRVYMGNEFSLLNL